MSNERHKGDYRFENANRMATADKTESSLSLAAVSNGYSRDAIMSSPAGSGDIQLSLPQLSLTGTEKCGLQSKCFYFEPNDSADGGKKIVKDGGIKDWFKKQSLDTQWSQDKKN